MSDDGVPSLEVGFLIETGDSFGELERLQRLMDSTEGQLLKQAGSIEKATASMVNLGGATATVRTFNAASSLAERDLRILERTGLSLSRTLEKQATNFGLNRDQMQALRVETVALGLAEQGRVEAAGELREKLQSLQSLQAQAAAAAESEARAVRDAAAAHAAFEMAARRGLAALREQESAAERDTAALRRLQAILDPAGAAQARLNQELAEARRLLTAAGASSEQLAQAQTILTQRATGVVTSTGQMRSGMQQLSFQLNDVATQFAAGTPPMIIFAQQSGQVVQALGLMTTGTKGLLGFLGGPWGMVMTSALVVLTPFVAKLWEAGDAAEDATKKIRSFATNADLAERATELVQMTAALGKLQAQYDRMAGPTSQGQAFFANTVAGKALKEKIELQRYDIDSTRSLIGIRGQQIDQIEAATAAEEAAKIGLREHNKELREQAKFAREAAKAQDELRQSYEGFLAIADPDKAALNKYAKDLAELAKVAAAFKFDPATLEQFQNAIREQMMRARDQLVALPAFEIKVDIDTSQLTQALPHFRTLQDSLDEMSEAAERLGKSLPDAFGRTGNAVADLLKIMADYGQAQQRIDSSVADDADKRQRSTKLQLDTMLGLTGAAKGLFDAHSKGYRAMEAAEKALAIIQIARTAQSVAAGAAQMFASLGPLGFPAVAAMLAVMASLGFRGGGGAGSAPKFNDGTGTVFGDSTAKSDSVKRSIDLLADLETDLLGVSRQMAASLKAIESNIGGLSRLVIRLGGDDGVGANAAAGVNTGYNPAIGKNMSNLILGGLPGLIVGPMLAKIPVIGDILGFAQKLLGGLFGSKTKIIGQGIFGGPQSLGSIEDSGFAGQSFADIKKTKKFFGLSTGSSYKTQFGDLDDQLETQFGKLLMSFADAIKLAAGPLGIGLDDIDAKLAGFIVDIGKIDLKDLTGDEIQEKLEGVFGAQADKMAQFAIAGLEQFQQVGEGYFETLIRVASTVDTVTTSLQMLGLSAQSLGTDASMAIAGFFDSAAAYQDAAGRYFEAFYTDAEQTAAKAAQLGKVFDGIGIAMPDTIAAFRSLVEAQDLTTEAGQKMYATLLQLAPAFAEIIGSGTSASSSSANAILRERNDLERQLMELAGDTAGIRAAELAQLDPTNRALQERIYALQDEAAAAQVAAQAAQELAAQQRAVAQERAGLERQMLELNGNTAALRELDLQNVDESNRDLLKQIFARQDAIAAEAAAQAAAAEAQRQAEQAAEEAARAAKALADAWSSIGDSIMDEVKRIRGGMLSEAQSYQQLQLQFFAATDAARAGSQDAAKSLPELARSMLEAAEATATDSLMLKRIRDVTAASLEQTYGVIATAMGLGGSAQTQEQLVQRFVDGVQASNAASGAAGDTGSEIRALRAEVAQMRAENNSGHAKTADEASGSRKVLERSQAYAADGNSLSVKVAA